MNNALQSSRNKDVTLGLQHRGTLCNKSCIGEALNTARSVNPLFDRSHIESIVVHKGAIALDNAYDLHTIFKR